MAMRIAVYDDHPLYRAGVVAALAGSEFIVWWDGDDVTDIVDIAGRSDIVLLDWTMSHAPVAIVEEIQRWHPRTHVAAVSFSEAREHVTEALEAGVLAYLAKDADAAELLEALRHVAGGRRYLQPTLAARLLS